MNNLERVARALTVAYAPHLSGWGRSAGELEAAMVAWIRQQLLQPDEALTLRLLEYLTERLEAELWRKSS